MNILILVNPIAGRGRAMSAAQELRGLLLARGHDAAVVVTRRAAGAEWLAPMLEGVSLLVIAGGDGAVRMACGPASRAGTPIFHLPYGTENLFARQWSMQRSPQELLRAIDAWRVSQVDLGRANGETFLLMASVGLDANVVEDLSACRSGAITHRRYLRPILRQLWQWIPPRLHIEVDGDAVGLEEPGCLVVANSRQYAWRIDPALRADMADGQLDAVFFPARGRRELLRWVLATRLRRHVLDPRLLYRRGHQVLVTAAEPFHYQLDGDTSLPPAEVACDGGRAVRRLLVEIDPGALPVLLPSG